MCACAPTNPEFKLLCRRGRPHVGSFILDPSSPARFYAWDLDERHVGAVKINPTRFYLNKSVPSVRPVIPSTIAMNDGSPFFIQLFLDLRLPFGTVPSVMSMEGHACGRSAWFLSITPFGVYWIVALEKTIGGYRYVLGHAPRCSLWSVVITENADINDRAIDMLFGIPSSVPLARLTTSEFEFRFLTSRQTRQQQDSDP
ncbi:hypothetical protein Tco_0917698 [Tanacetum coccineum]